MFSFERRYRGVIQLAIFDWAGTTVDYGCFAPAVVYREVFHHNGVGISIEEAREPMGVHKLVHLRAISQMPSVARRWRDVHGRPCGEEDVQAMYAEFLPLQLKCLAQYADVIPGTIETMAALRRQDIKIGSTTGYTSEIMEVLSAEAARRGFQPDATVCASDVPAGRPEPWMCFENARLLRVYPMEACVKVGDTLSDIEEGLNAGMWTIGLAKTGNELGLSETEIDELPPGELQTRLQRAYRRMAQCGAHFVVDAIADVPAVIERINGLLAQGARP